MSNKQGEKGNSTVTTITTTRRKSKTLTIRALGGVALAASLLAACSTAKTSAVTSKKPSSAIASTSGSGAALPAATVSLWMVTSGTANAATTDAAAAFEKVHPNDRIEVHFYPGGPYKTKIALALSAGDPPTMFMSWGGGVLEQYVNAGEVAPLGRPSWLKQFLPISLTPVTFKGETYGVPIKGTEPVFFFYNKKVLASVGATQFPTTWSGLLSLAAKLKAKGVIPFSLADASGWPGLMYLEYLVQRIGGPNVYAAIAEGEKDAWSNPAVTSALQDMLKLVRDGYFEKGYDALHDSTGVSDALLYTGKAAMQLMGNWEITNILPEDKAFVESEEMGQAPFPAVNNGKGNPKDLTGNVAIYVSISQHASVAQRKVAEAFMRTLASKSFAQDLVNVGEVPVVRGSQSLLGKTKIGKYYLVPEYNDVKKAPVFTYSWDQALGRKEGSTLDSNVADVLSGAETISQFENIMNAQHPSR